METTKAEEYRSEDGSDGARAPEDLRDQSARAGDADKDNAGARWDDAKRSARSKLNEQKDVAADGLGDVAGALREAARRRESSGQADAYAQLSGSAADGLERLSRSLRTRDVGTMLRDVEHFAREQPVAFFGLALAAGFIGARFIKAGDPAYTQT